MDQALKDRRTRQITIGGTKVGGNAPVVVQSMCATRTIDVDETVAQAHQLANAGAGIVRIAIDSEKEIPAVKEIRGQTKGIVLAVDLQENYRSRPVAPHVDKLRYNPGHLYHLENEAMAGEGEVPGRRGGRERLRHPRRRELRLGRSGEADKYPGDQLAPIVERAEHCELLDRLGFTRFACRSRIPIRRR